MVIFIDENMPPQLALALNILQETLNLKNGTQLEVKSIIKEFKPGSKDEDWIPMVSGQYVITQDYRIQTTRHLKTLYASYNVGVFFIKSPKHGMSFWDMTKLLIDRWQEILAIIHKEQTPFAYIGKQRSRFTKLD